MSLGTNPKNQPLSSEEGEKKKQVDNNLFHWLYDFIF
jgi:hypothetical protein